MTTPNHDGQLPDYEKLKDEIDSRYPSGRFVALRAGQVIADSESHPSLVKQLQALGETPQNMLIVQAGVEYPESALILLCMEELGRDRHA
jgi:hypothetical protein